MVDDYIFCTNLILLNKSYENQLFMSDAIPDIYCTIRPLHIQNPNIFLFSVFLIFSCVIPYIIVHSQLEEFGTVRVVIECYVFDFYIVHIVPIQYIKET